PFASLAYFRVCLRQQSTHIGLSKLCARRPMDRQALPHVGNALFFLALRRQRPASLDGPPGSHERKPLLGRQANGGLCPCLRLWPFAAELMQPGHTRKGPGEAE